MWRSRSWTWASISAPLPLWPTLRPAWRPPSNSVRGGHSRLSCDIGPPSRAKTLTQNKSFPRHHDGRAGSSGARKGVGTRRTIAWDWTAQTARWTLFALGGSVLAACATLPPAPTSTAGGGVQSSPHGTDKPYEVGGRRYVP